MGKDAKKGYVDRYIEKIQDMQELEEVMVVNLTLRINAYYAELLDATTRKLGIKKSPFLCEPVQDFIMKAAKKCGVADERGILKEEYRGEE